MQFHNLDFTKVNALSKRDVTFQTNPQIFQEFLNFTPDIEGLKQALDVRKNFPINRALLYDVLSNQYKEGNTTEKQKSNISKIKDEDTFTIITAHQPAILTGPLYYIYKIFSVINLCDKLKIEFPQYEFVPVFINGSEDHDFDEIKSINLFNKKISWLHESGGPVGRFDLSGLQDLLNEVGSVFSDKENSKNLIDVFYSIQNSSTNYNEFVFNIINHLFGSYGLIVANMDNVDFKRAFSPKMKEELLNGISEKLIKSTQEKISTLGFNNQAFAREINLFYMQNGFRERIIREGSIFKINNSEITFTETEIIQELEKHPERFSPNVIMRPLYEENIFPNLAYIGGGGELAYWMERKAQFNHFNIFFPVLLRRDSVLIINKLQLDTLNKYNIKIEDIFLSEEYLCNKYLNENTEIEINLSEQYQSLNKIFDDIKTKALLVDKSLNDYVNAEHVKTHKLFEQIESKIRRSLKKNEEVSLNQIKNLKSKLFPENSLQERHDNFLQIYNSLGEKFFDILKEKLNPLDINFKVIVLDN